MKVEWWEKIFNDMESENFKAMRDALFLSLYKYDFIFLLELQRIHLYDKRVLDRVAVNSKLMDYEF